MFNFRALILFLGLSLVLSACDSNKEKPGSVVARPAALAVTAYESDGAYADVLAECALAEQAQDSCTLEKLPPLAMITPYPEVADIMERVVVSHSWMGQRFEQLLEVLPADLLQLFGAITVVVIDADIRPSYFYFLTGAIYLDPANLWLEPEEAAVIDTAEDYRAAFADPMNFRVFARDLIDNEYPHPFYSLVNPQSRTIDDIVIPMAALLFHELAHANDIVSPQLYSELEMTSTIYAAAEQLQQDFPSTLLNADSPLESQLMLRMAAILYRGVPPNQNDVTVTGGEVGLAFEADRANDSYSYTTQLEDLAMLFQEAMMKIHYDVDRDTAFVSVPSENIETPTCEHYIIQWGVRGRIGEQRVKERAAFVIQKMLPQSDYSVQLEAIPTPLALPSDVDWCSALEQMAPQQAAQGLSKPGSSPSIPRQVRPDDMYRAYDIIDIGSHKHP